MMLRRTPMAGLVVLMMVAAAAWHLHARTNEETFTATATVQTAGGATATAPVRVTVTRTMSPEEAAKFTSALQTGGSAALRTALSGVPPTGSIQVGSGAPTPTRLTLDRTTDRGRLLTIVTDQPILFLGAGLPGARPKEGYDFAVLDLDVDRTGAGSGMLAPAAKIRVSDGAIVVEDYGAEAIRLAGVKKAN